MNYLMKLPSLKVGIIIFFVGLLSSLTAQKVPEKPKILYPVFDQANLLTAQEKDALNQKLIKFSDSSSTEILVIIIPTTGGEDANYLATMYGEKWQIGQKGVDNGVVFLIATKDHTMSIQQGRAVEQYLTASVAGQIMDYLVTPSFKNGQYYQGIDRGTTAIMEAVQGKFKPLVKKEKTEGHFNWLVLIFIVIIIVVIISKSNDNNGGDYNDDDVILSRKGSRRYRGGFFPFPGSFGGGGFGGGSSGGGFGGFGGGGSFGGGGASGGW